MNYQVWHDMTPKKRNHCAYKLRMEIALLEGRLELRRKRLKDLCEKFNLDLQGVDDEGYAEILAQLLKYITCDDVRKPDWDV